MTAGDIAGQLAKADPNDYDGDYHQCHFCGVSLPIVVKDHRATCVWRMAAEWDHKHGLKYSRREIAILGGDPSL